MTMTTIKLGGIVGKRFGKEYTLDLNGFRDGMTALCAMKPGFEKFMRTAEERGLVFAVFADERNLGKEELDLAGRNISVIRIQPIVQGSKQAGMFQTILGVALIIAGAFTGGTTAGAGMAILAGVAIAAGGVVQMLAPTTKTGTADKNEDGNNPSYGFGSAVTTTAQGNPYPLLYGEREIGGAVESGGIYTQDNI